VDWGWQGLLAYGSQTLVVIVEPRTVQVYQTLDHHKHAVTKVKWCYENYYHSLASPYGLRLASSDSAGKIVVWDVSEASVRAEFSENSKPILDMEWLSNQV
jgi:WD40 repeat protein